MDQRTDVDFVRAMVIGLAIIGASLFVATNITDDQKPATVTVEEGEQP